MVGNTKRIMVNSLGLSKFDAEYLRDINAPSWVFEAKDGDIIVIKDYNNKISFFRRFGSGYDFSFMPAPLPACYDYSDKPMD